MEYIIQLLKKIVASVGENLIGLTTHLLSMILIEQHYGHKGLGIFAYFISVYFTTSFISECGIPLYFKSNYLKFKNNELVFLSSCVKTILTTSLICSAIFFISTSYDIFHTNIAQDSPGFLIIGIAIPFRNLGRVILTKLQVEGQIAFVSKHSIIKNIFHILILYFLANANTDVSILPISFLFSELLFIFFTIKTIPVFKILFQKIRYIQTFKHALAYFFYDKALDFFFYIDFFILGIFMPAEKLGIYAETGVFIRGFLLITISVKPIIQRHLLNLSARKNSINLEKSIFKICSIIFYLNSVLCIYFIVYYDTILNYLFLTKGEEYISFIIFIYTLPGLIFFSLASVFEIYLSLSDHSEKLKTIIMKVMIFNIAANYYLIPFSGLNGAAIATMISMSVYFLLIINSINIRILKIFGFDYLVAATILYLLCKSSDFIPLPGILLPIALFISYYLAGVFDYRNLKTLRKHIKQKEFY